MTRYASQQDFMQIPVKQLVAEAGATAPLTPVAGQVWTDTSTTPAKVRWYDGISQWIAADGTSIPANYITNAMIAPTAAIALSKLAVDPLARANHTGTQVAATISDFNTAVRTNRLDQMAAPSNPLDLNGQRLINMATPTLPSDGVTKAYADNLRGGISVKDPVRVVATTNLNLSATGSAIDGFTMTAGDRFLASAQNTGTENGIYIWNGVGATATRSTDADGTGEVIDGTTVAVADGTSAGQQWIQTATAGGAPGTWTQTWARFSFGGQTYTDSTGLTLSGTQFSITAPVPVSLGGTGATTLSVAKTQLGFTTKYAADLGAVTAGVPYVHAHNLGSLDVIAGFFMNADKKTVDIEYAVTSTNQITLYSDLTFAAAAIRAVVVS